LNKQQSLSVQQVTQHIANVLALDARLKDIWVEGEVSNFKRHAASGHAYFTLKDEKSQLKCVMWKTSVARLQYIPTDGDRVRAHGRIEVYADAGQYQLYADAMQPAGVGALFLQFERLKARLNAEGLFDSERKRPLPQFPRVIGVVTAPNAAAFQDILNVLRRRYPLARVLLSPTLVQGEDAPPQIVRALRRLAADGRADVILLARGGGSIEDLWAFNDERVARAVAESVIPVVTGVGHEIDFTIVDFVSDLRAPTPSAGAELITPDSDVLRGSLYGLNAALENAMLGGLTLRRGTIEDHARTLRHLSPERTIQNARQRLDTFSARMATATASRLKLQRERLNAISRALEAANPEALLSRGYAIVTRAGDGKRITDANDAAPGTGITITLGSGELRATVKERILP